MREDEPIPERVQLKRTRGWRMPPDTVKVDRSTKWGNPYVVGSDRNPAGVMVRDHRHAVDLYRTTVATDPQLVAAARAELRGKNLACWCRRPEHGDDVCHAAVLLQMANALAKQRT